MFKTLVRVPRVFDPEKPSGEGVACLWAWAWPEMIGWPKPFVWLFSPPADNRRWPGDLWGIDADGDLLVVEAKTYKPGRRVDPFEDFVGAGRAVTMGKSLDITTAKLRNRWQELLDSEINFARAFSRELKSGIELDGTYPGVVPYSRHRASVQRWPGVYLDRVAPWVTGPEYASAAESYLVRRLKRRDLRPHVIGLVVAPEGRTDVLSSRSLTNIQKLRRLVGADRVSAVAVTSSLGRKHVAIAAKAIPI